MEEFYAAYSEALARLDVDESLRLVKQFPDQAQQSAYALLGQSEELLRASNYLQASQAVRAAYQIFQLLDHDEGVALAYNQLGRTYEGAGYAAMAVPEYERALALGRTLNDVRLVSTVLTNLAGAYAGQQQFDRAFELYDESLASCTGEGSEDLARQVRMNSMATRAAWGSQLLASEMLPEALAQLAMASEAAEALGERDCQASLLGRMSAIHIALGDPIAARGLTVRARALLRQTGNRQEEGRVLAAIATAQQNHGDHDDALATYAEARDVSRAAGDVLSVGRALFNIGMTHRLRTDGEAALESFEAALPIMRQIKDQEGIAAVLRQLGRCYLERKDAERGEDALLEASALSMKLEHTAAGLDAIRALVSYYEEAGDKVKTVFSLETELWIEREAPEYDGQATEIVSTLERLGKAQLAAKDHDAAIASFTEAVELNRRAGGTREIELLASLGNACTACGRHAEATTHFAAMLSFCERVGDRRALMFGLSFLGGALFAAGDKQTAVARFRDAVAVAREVGDRTREGAELATLAAAHEAVYDWESTMACYQEAIAVQEAIGATKDLTENLSRLGVIYIHRGRSAEAIACFDRALALAIAASDVRMEGMMRTNLGRACSGIGNMARAFEELEQALALARAGADRHAEMLALHHLGGVCNDSGTYAQAIASREQALAIGRELGDRSVQAAVLDGIGVSYRRLGQYDQAMAHYQQALPLWREVGDRVGEIGVLENMGTVSFLVNDVNGALATYLDALEIAKEIGLAETQASLLNRVGLVFDRQGQQEQARGYLERALSMSRAAGNRSEEATILQNLSKIYADLGERELGIVSATQSLELSRAVGDRSLEAIVLQRLAEFAAIRGDMTEAMVRASAARAIACEVGERPSELEALTMIGLLRRRQGDEHGAIDAFREAIDLLESIRGDTSAGASRESLMGEQHHVYAWLVELLVASGEDASAFEYVERGKARSSLEMLAEGRSGIRKGLDPVLRAEEELLYDRMFDLTLSVRGATSSAESDSMLTARRECERQLAVIERRIREASPLSAQIIYPRGITVDEVQEMLRPGEALVEYASGEAGVTAFVIGRRTFECHVLPAPALDGRVNALVAPMRQARPEGWDAAASATLYRELVEPVRPAIESAMSSEAAGVHERRLIIVPDATLCYLPFEMLATDEAGTRFLVHDVPVSYAMSAAILKLARERGRSKRPERRELFALAPFAPDDGAVMAPSVPAAAPAVGGLRAMAESPIALPHSAEEVREISASFATSSCLIGADATEARFRELATGTRYLHLATHGYLDSARPLDSGLLLHQGLLHAYEIFNLELDADLTVLSACETGLGALERGEGLVGLSRAFLFAGSPSLVVSLWSVADVSTCSLMRSFYQHLQRGVSRPAALRLAKLELLETPPLLDDFGYEISYANPFYWAPFILLDS